VIPTADRQKGYREKCGFLLPTMGHVRLIDPATQPRILPDMGVKVTFLEDEKAEKWRRINQRRVAAVALVPQAAVHQDNSSKFVFVVKGDTVERRAVTVGFRSRHGCRDSCRDSAGCGCGGERAGIPA